VVLTDAAGEMDKKNAEKDKLKAETAFYEMDENKDNRYLPSFICSPPTHPSHRNVFYDQQLF